MPHGSHHPYMRLTQPHDGKDMLLFRNMAARAGKKQGFFSPAVHIPDVEEPLLVGAAEDLPPQVLRSAFPVMPRLGYDMVCLHNLRLHMLSWARVGERTRGMACGSHGHWYQLRCCVWKRQFRACSAAAAASCCVVPCERHLSCL